MVVGTVLGTFFGMSMADAAWVPQWLKSCMIVGEVEVPGMGMFNIQMLTFALKPNLFVYPIAFTTIARQMWNTKRFGFRANVSTWGWLLLIVGGIILAILGVGSFISPEAIKYAVIVVGTLSALGIYIFNTPGQNPLINIGAGLWDTYNMATGILGIVWVMSLIMLKSELDISFIGKSCTKCVVLRLANHLIVIRIDKQHGCIGL